MPNTKQAKKRLRQDVKRRARNLRRLKRYKEVERQIKKLVVSNQKEQAAQLLPKFYKLIDKAASHGPLHKNKAGRKKKQIVKLFA